MGVSIEVEVEVEVERSNTAVRKHQTQAYIFLPSDEGVESVTFEFSTALHVESLPR
jgi:hypothetical protein